MAGGQGIGGSTSGPGVLIKWALGGIPEKPKLPPDIEISPEEIQKQTVAGNLGVLPKAQELAGAVNIFNQQQLEAMTRAALGSTLFDSIRENIGRLTRGELTAGEQKAIRASLAGRAGGLGVLGSQLGTSIEAFGLSRESLARTQAGLQSAAQWLGLTRAPVFDISSSFFTPQQRLAFAERDREHRLSYQWMANQLRALPSPFQAEFASAVQSEFDTASRIAASYFSGGIGGMGGGGGGSWAGASHGSGDWAGYSEDMMGSYLPSWK